jgi:multiple sugar transport system permease protein
MTLRKEPDIPEITRPVGITVISILLWLGSLAAVLVAIKANFDRLQITGMAIAALLQAVLGFGLWTLRNSARIFSIFLLVLNAAGDLIALIFYAAPHGSWRVAIEAVGQLAVSLFLIWYLDRPKVRHAFGNHNPWARVLQILVLTTITGLLAFPFYWMAITALKQNSDLYAPENNPFIFNSPATLEQLRFLFTETRFVRWLGNTALVGLIVVGITLLLALPAAYALARLTGRWGERLGIGIFLTYLVPPTLLFIPLSRVVASLGLQDSIWALVVVYPSFTVPFSIWLLMGFFKSIPRELEDAAMVDGLTRFGAFVKMVVPISVSGILTVVIFVFTLVTQEFVYALTFIAPESQQMVGVGIPTFLIRGDVYYWGSLMAACLIASIPIAFLYNLFLDRFIAGFTVGAVKG